MNFRFIKKQIINKFFNRFFYRYIIKKVFSIKIAMTYLQSVLVISLANAKDSLTVYPLIVNGDKTDTKSFANLYYGILIATVIGLKDGQLLMTVLCTLAWICNIPGRYLVVEMFLYNRSVRLSLSWASLIIRLFENVFNSVLRINYKIQIFIW